MERTTNVENAHVLALNVLDDLLGGGMTAVVLTGQNGRHSELLDGAETAFTGDEHPFAGLRFMSFDSDGRLLAKTLDRIRQLVNRGFVEVLAHVADDLDVFQGTHERATDFLARRGLIIDALYLGLHALKIHFELWFDLHFFATFFLFCFTLATPMPAFL